MTIEVEVPAVATLTAQVTPTATLTIVARSMNTSDLARLLPAGGTTGQVARKASNADYDVEWHTLTASDVGAPSGSGSSTGSNTGDQDLSGLVTKATTVNGHPLSANVVVSASDVGAPAGSGTSTGTNTGDQTGVTGNAGTATALQTGRRINGKLFDGTADIATLNRTAVKTANYSAAANELVPCDTTSGGFTITAPTAPPNGTIVAVKHIIQGDTNTVTIALGGSDVFNRAGGATTATLPLSSQAAVIQYDSSTAIWTLVSNDVPLAQMDARYEFKPALASATDATSITPALIVGTTRVTQTNTQTAGTLTLNNPTGAPYDGQVLVLRVTCTNAQTAAFGTLYRGTNQLSLPSAWTGAGKTDGTTWRYDATPNKWTLIGISFGA